MRELQTHLFILGALNVLCGRVTGSSKFNAPQPSMLQQSRLQLSLGLDAETPIDLRSWGYGEESNTTAPGQGEDPPPPPLPPRAMLHKSC